MNISSKLPDVGTTIFTVISRRAAELAAVNLGQGFPDYEADPRLAALVHEAMLAGHNQYAPMPGLPALRERIAAKLKRSYDIDADAESEITVTLGATEAIFSAVQSEAATIKSPSPSRSSSSVTTTSSPLAKACRTSWIVSAIFFKSRFVQGVH